MEEAARKVDEGDRTGAKSILKRIFSTLKTAPEPSAPAVRTEMERVNEYSKRLDDLDAMAPVEVQEMQKEQKYRSYQLLNQQ